jgi:hypothetical protein
MLLEELSIEKIRWPHWEIVAATFRLVAQCLNQLHYGVLPYAAGTWGKEAGAWSWHLCVVPRSVMSQPYFHSPMRLYGVVFNHLSTGTIVLLLVTRLCRLVHCLRTLAAPVTCLLLCARLHGHVPQGKRMAVRCGISIAFSPGKFLCGLCLVCNFHSAALAIPHL